MKEFKADSVWVLSDFHGEMQVLYDKIELVPKNSIIIQLGDGFALGFPGKTLEGLKYTNKLLKEKNITILSLAGNHEAKGMFWSKYLEFGNIIFIPDYFYCKINGKTFFFLGGAISIDRSARTPGVSWWEDEVIDQDPTKLVKLIPADVAITHSAPSYCAPTQFSGICFDYFRYDAELEGDLIKERKWLDKVFQIVRPKLAYRGHFHFHASEHIQGCWHYLLDINEIQEIRLETL